MVPTFPIYRKLLGGAHLYRIEGMARFTELQRVGSKWLRHVVVATQYPERLRIADMISGGEGAYGNATIEEWELAEAEVR